MSRLEEIKNEYAKEVGFKNWDMFISDYSDANPNWGDYGKSHPSLLDKHWDIVTERYAEEVAKASLEKASENCYATEIFGLCFNDIVKIEKSITNEENIILL